MITQDKITDIFCMVDEFSKKFDTEVAKGDLFLQTEFTVGVVTLPFPMVRSRPF